MGRSRATTVPPFSSSALTLTFLCCICVLTDHGSTGREYICAILPHLLCFGVFSLSGRCRSSVLCEYILLGSGADTSVLQSLEAPNRADTLSVSTRLPCVFIPPSCVPFRFSRFCNASCRDAIALRCDQVPPITGTGFDHSVSIRVDVI